MVLTTAHVPSAAMVACRLQQEIQYLVLSDKNLGKGGAWNQIFGGAPGEIIVYSDSDVLSILDGWPGPWKSWKPFQKWEW